MPVGEGVQCAVLPSVPPALTISRLHTFHPAAAANDEASHLLSYPPLCCAPQAVHPADALLLPLLERLLAAGCRPTVYRDVPVRLEGGPLSIWKELDPLVHDSALDLEGKNRCE